MEWNDVIECAKMDIRMSYKAPMDYKAFTVHVLKMFKNGKIRIKILALTFTVDKGHADRFECLGCMDCKAPTQAECICDDLNFAQGEECACGAHNTI